MKTKGSIILLSILFLTGCHTYKEYNKESFPNYIWAYSQGVSFKPTIDDATKNYTLTLGMRHLHGLQVNSISLNVTVISPSGKEIAQKYDFKIMDRQGNYIGKCAGDICDLETVINDNFKFEEVGEYTFIINHMFQDSKIPGVLEFGLIIDEKES